MEITYLVIINVVTLVLGAITKTFIDKVPNRYIPIQNLFIGIVATIIVIATGIETDILNAAILCLLATLGAGGAVDLVKTRGR